MAEVQPVQQSKSLSIKHLFNHFFLLHDFFHRLTRTKALNSDYFDLQIQINNGMNNAVSTGSKIAQVLTFGSLCWYFIRGNSIKLRFVYGFLFMYWYNHIITLGSYAGVLCRMPGVYKKTAKYYQSHPQQRNLIGELNNYLEKTESYEEPQLILTELFQAQIEDKSFVANQFFIKNKEKYLTKDLLQQYQHNNKKLKYLDSFLTRYVYYSFARWYTRMGQFLTFEDSNQ